MTDLTTLYQDIILDHYRAKHHAGLREPFDVQVTHVNPSCGDELELRLTTEGETIADVSYDAQGCSISQASTSIMTDLVIGGSMDRAQELYDGFLAMLEGQGTIDLDETTYGDAIAFNGVAQFPARVKCAMLGWAALRDAVMRVKGRSDGSDE
ncbi:MAG: SUF system NifU family Fe-S cluster assembly protein [Propionibacteriaceae bacterium]|nr:SUF system NifU family Fe-S cluster assembly protein [Propionibacteriaceae bacterium]